MQVLLVSIIMMLLLPGPLECLSRHHEAWRCRLATTAPRDCQGHETSFELDKTQFFLQGGLAHGWVGRLLNHFTTLALLAVLNNSHEQTRKSGFCCHYCWQHSPDKLPVHELDASM